MFKYFQCFGMLQAYILTECEMQENTIQCYDHKFDLHFRQIIIQYIKSPIFTISLINLEKVQQELMHEIHTSPNQTRKQINQKQLYNYFVNSQHISFTHVNFIYYFTSYDSLNGIIEVHQYLGLEISTCMNSCTIDKFICY